MADKMHGAALTHEYNAILSVGTTAKSRLWTTRQRRCLAIVARRSGGDVASRIPLGSSGRPPAKRDCTRIKRAAQGRNGFPVDIALRPIVTKHGVHLPFVADLTKKDPRMVH